MSIKKTIHSDLILPFLIILISCNSNHSETTIFIVRHAEKDLTDTTDNPALTQAGIDRANSLLAEMDGVEFDAIYSTYFDRNINTVKPIADDRNLPITNYQWHKYQSSLDIIKASPGKTYLICGHGDNILPMIEYVGGVPPQKSLKKHEYNKIFKVIIGEEEVKVEVNEY